MRQRPDTYFLWVEWKLHSKWNARRAVDCTPQRRVFGLSSNCASRRPLHDEASVSNISWPLTWSSTAASVRSRWPRFCDRRFRASASFHQPTLMLPSRCWLSFETLLLEQPQLSVHLTAKLFSRIIRLWTLYKGIMYLWTWFPFFLTIKEDRTNSWNQDESLKFRTQRGLQEGFASRIWVCLVYTAWERRFQSVLNWPQLYKYY